MKWMIEPDAFPNEPYRLQGALEDLEIPHTICKIGRDYEYYTGSNPDDNQMVFHGSKQFAEVIKKHTNWQVFWNTPQYECRYYYPRFGEHLVNHGYYVMVPYGDLVRCSPLMLFHELLVGSKLFLKSDEFKAFSGDVVHTDNWAKEMRKIGCHAEPETIVVVAAPVSEIRAEYRFVVADGKIVTGSRYKPTRGIPEDEALKYAEMILNQVKFNPDPIWILDVAETNLGWRVLEVGPFSCCALYECEAELVLDAVGKILRG